MVKKLVLLAILVTPLIATLQSAPSAVQGVVVDKEVFKGKQVSVLLSGNGIAHEQIKNQDKKMDYWILQSPEIVQIGHHSYLRGRVMNGPINIKDKVVWLEMSNIKLIREN